MDVYARISVALTGETIKTDDQIEMGLEDIERRGLRVGKVWRDDSLSAWNPKVVREHWEKMMARIESGESGGVWVLDLTRFTRKPLEGERLIEAVQNGARVLSRSMEYDLMTADGRAAFREAIVKAAQESDKISERVTIGKRRRARRGLAAGGSRGYGMPGLLPKPQGWRKGDPRIPVPDGQIDAEREVIREGYRRLLAGESGSAVVADLTARGVRGVNGRPFTVPGFFSMLRRPAVAGLLNRHGEAVGEMVGAEPVVAREQWERLCAILDARRTGRPAGKVHVLSNLVFCPCGAPMRGRPAKGVYVEDGAPCREYRCMVGCGRNAIDARVLERAVAVGVKSTLGDPKRAERLAVRAARVRGEKAKIQAEIDRLNADADSLAEKVHRWGEARVEKAMGPLLRQINALETQKAGLEEPESSQVAAREVAAEWDRAERAGDLEAMRGMVRTAFPKLAIRYRTGWGDHSTERIAWDGDAQRPEVAA